MTPKETEGYELAKGAVSYICRVLFIAAVIITLLNPGRLTFKIGVDDSDAGVKAGEKMRRNMK